MLSWSWRSIKLLFLHLVGVPYYFAYTDDARSHTNQGIFRNENITENNAWNRNSESHTSVLYKTHKQGLRRCWIFLRWVYGADATRYLPKLIAFTARYELVPIKWHDNTATQNHNKFLALPCLEDDRTFPHFLHAIAFSRSLFIHWRIICDFLGSHSGAVEYSSPLSCYEASHGGRSCPAKFRIIAVP
jgi:hypothetical protein